MSSRSNAPFECHWRASRLLLALYCLALCLALASTLLAPLPLGLQALCLVGCLMHAGWVLPRHILLSHASAWRGLRHDEDCWRLWSQQAGWQPVQLRPDSLALPLAVILRYRQPGRWWSQSICIARDALAHDQHRRLRVRLKFSRHRWAAPE